MKKKMRKYLEYKVLKKYDLIKKIILEKYALIAIMAVPMLLI